MEMIWSSPAATPDPSFWRDRRVLLTGHTGFKGSWLAIWLHRLGAKVHGLSLDPPTQPNLFHQARVDQLLASDTRGDVRTAENAIRAMQDSCPQVVLHLAAQSLVRPSYSDPLGTLATNIMGTAHILDAALKTSSVEAVLVVTTDKCYENREWLYPYREVDPLGGHDPYSTSKAGAELVTACWRASFVSRGGVGIATARAGNVIGAGDWATDRLLPDCIRAFEQGNPVVLRRPNAVRPWQHVLEPLCGYLLLSEKLASANRDDFARAWNFGPGVEGDATVAEVAELAAQVWGQGARIGLAPVEGDLHEAGLLRLDSTLARSRLAWQSRWSLRDSVAATVEGYRRHSSGEDLGKLISQQILDYEAAGQ